ncbi:hypothetical protein CAL26_04385 [Bordetella genomosp. 9]|uniref:NEL domain-containing protein n=1 Tax=Bordetella genomosp. 9 TaxID=1416803 RepID=A0A261RNC6_9BORD|nr:hypothetical protein CAL26_04385 [Bordetella genomosp. 9]
MICTHAGPPAQTCTHTQTQPDAGSGENAGAYRDGGEMALRFARAAGAMDGTPAAAAATVADRPPVVATPRPPAQTEPMAVTPWPRLAAFIGSDVATQLGLKPNRYTAAELADLGRQFIVDHALHGDRAARLRVLAALTSASKRLQRSNTPSGIVPPATDSHDRLAAWIADFLVSATGNEMAVAHAAEDLAALRPRTGQFDAYARAATDKTLVLVDRWLAWIAATLGADLGASHVDIQSVNLQLYRREVTFPLNKAFVNDNRVDETVPATGYIAAVHAHGLAHRYFLSTRDGSVHPLPLHEPTADWVLRHSDLVLGVAPDRARPDPKRTSRRSRVVLDPVAQGRRDDLHTWLKPALRQRYDRLRPANDAAAPTESVADTLLDFIPFRRMVQSIRHGEYGTAALSGAVDLATILLPMVGAGFRAAAEGGVDLARAAQAIGGELAGGGLGRAAAFSRPAMRSELRAGLRAALQSLHGTSALSQGLRPLDIDGMATALRARSPRIANALELQAQQARGIVLGDGWRLPDPPQTPAENAGIEALNPIMARGPDGGTMPLLTYGSDAARAYTRIHPSGERSGALLLADRDGGLHASLPAETFERYSVGNPELAQALGQRRPGADGVIAHQGRTYARIAGAHVEILSEPASTAERPVWRVAAPEGARRDIVFHRVAYDKDKDLWLRADPARLKGGQGGSASTPRQSGPAGPSAGEGTRADQAGPSGAAAPGAPGAPVPAGLVPRALPSAAATAQKLKDFKQVLLEHIADPTPAKRDGVLALLNRVQADPRGRTILSAMSAYHELTGKTADIVLQTGNDALLPRPSLASPLRGPRWNLALDALANDRLESSVQELAAVYNNLTGIGEGEDPYAAILASGGPPLAADEEAALANWVGDDKGSFLPADPTRFIPSPRQLAADELRAQIKRARCHGGVDKTTLTRVLHNHPSARLPGLTLDLAELNLTDIPPLPVDVRKLVMHNNPITDWSRLPATLHTLDAAQTSATVVDHLPPELRELDISDNDLGSIPVDKLPRGLTRLAAEMNMLTEIPAGLPETLLQLHLADNALRRWPSELPPRLRVLKLSGNYLAALPPRLPPDLEVLDLSENIIWQVHAGVLPPRLRTLCLADNLDLFRLPPLPPTLSVLYVDATALTTLPEDLPRGLRELYANDMNLTRLPDNLPRGLTVLGVADNRLSRLPANITELTRCDIYLDGNPIDPTDLPTLPEGRRGPVFHLSGMTPGLGTHASRTVGQAVRHWLGGNAGDTAARWESIGETLEHAPPHRIGAVEFRRLLDRLRGTTLFTDGATRAHVRAWLEELSRPDREPLLKSTLEMCAGATESCEDRVILAWNELRKLWTHDDIRMGRYDGRPADALQAMRQLFRERKLQEIAYRRIVRMAAIGPGMVDDVEVYLAYVVGLRDRLALAQAPSDMAFFHLSDITPQDLDRALREVRDAELAAFYRDLVVDDTWNALIKRAMPARYAAAESRKIEQSSAPLREQVRARLLALGLDPDDQDAYSNAAPGIWRDMLYDIMEPLTRDYLQAAGVALPPSVPARDTSPRPGSTAH